MLPRRPSIGDVAILPVEEAGFFKQQVMGEDFFFVLQTGDNDVRWANYYRNIQAYKEKSIFV